MDTIIGAEAAKLASLQIDTLQKIQSGQITLCQWERFNNLSIDDKEARFGDGKKSEPTVPVEPTEKFALLVDIGIITVPDDYNHTTWLKTFNKKNCKKFCHYDNAVSDKNFPNPTRILKPGDKLRARAFKQVVHGTTTSEEHMKFLASQKAIHTGAQGASLVFNQKRDQLPKGFWYASFDEEKRLWEDADGYRRVPDVRAYSDGDFNFNLGNFEDVWDGNDAFFCFSDVEPVSGE
ncbi:MAG: hypothetical protein Q7R75_01565 [bacterium]|nr:hypothetical protein [bacterium]